MYIVTGSKGFIGRELVKYLKANGENVLEFDLKDGKLASQISPQKQDVVVHLGAETSVFNERLNDIELNNIREFMEVVRKCKNVGCKLIYASSSTATNPTSMYGLSKKFDEDFAKIYYPIAVGLRFYNVYSETPRQDTLLAKLLEGECLLYNNGKQKRHFTYIGDIIKGILMAEKLEGGIYTICNPQYISIKEFADMIPNTKYNLTDEKRKYDSNEQIVNTDDSKLIEMEYTKVEDILRNIVH